MNTQRRLLLQCCSAAGLFTSVLGAQAMGLINPCRAGGLPEPLRRHPLLAACWQGIDPAALWDVHAHLLGTGDSGSGCRVSAQMSQWWHPVESVRRKAILNGACVPADAPSIDRAYVQRLAQLAHDFPPGARWLLYAFDEALDEQRRPRPEWTTFHVPCDQGLFPLRGSDALPFKSPRARRKTKLGCGPSEALQRRARAFERQPFGRVAERARRVVAHLARTGVRAAAHA